MLSGTLMLVRRIQRHPARTLRMVVTLATSVAVRSATTRFW